MNVCLDITPIGVPRTRWTGVARTSWEFANWLGRDSSLNLRFSAAGTLHAQDFVEQHLDRAGLGGRFLAPPVDRGSRMLLEAQSGGGVSGKIAKQVLRGVNLVRSPIRKSELQHLNAFLSLYAGIPRQFRAAPNIRCGIYLHDLIPFLLPEYASDKQRSVLARILHSIEPDDLVIVNSECTRLDVSRWLDRDPEHIQVVQLAADPAIFRPDRDPASAERLRKKYALPDGPYALSLHSAARHKNIPMLIRAYAAYRRRKSGSALSLVIAGGKGDPAAEIAVAGGLTADDLEGVIFAGYIEDVDLAPLYSGARAFLFPSFYEGFGLPVLEALFCGVPVFASDRASLPEILYPLSGPHSEVDRLLPPDDIEAWTNAFTRAETLPPLDSAAIAEVRERFSWARAATELATLLHAAVGSSHRSTTETAGA